MASIFDSFDPPTTYFELDAVPIVNTPVTSDTFRLLTIFFSNITAVDRTVTVTNTAGKVLIQDMVVAANTPMPALQFGMVKMVGLKWVADAAGVNAIVEGFPSA